MKIIIQDTAHESIDNIFEYLSNYSISNAIETTELIYEYIYSISQSPYIGKYVLKISNKNIREIICRRYKNGYRIIYYINKFSKTVYILYVANAKQNFNHILKVNNYFKNVLNY